MFNLPNINFTDFKTSYYPVNYTWGPPSLTGYVFASGERVTGQYAAWYDYNDGKIHVSSLQSNTTTNMAMTGGSVLNLFPEVVTSDKNRISSLSMAFDNNGSPFVAIQDNGDSNFGFKDTPKIRIAASGGAFKKEWRGLNPTVYSTLNINYPYYDNTGIKFPIYMSGTLGCYYTDPSGTNLYVRFLNDEFTNEVLINSGLISGYKLIHQDYTPLSYNNLYTPYRKILIYLDENRNMLVLGSKPMINFAADDFNRYETGTMISGLQSGYGRWARESVLSYASGIIRRPLDVLFYDMFETYVSGSISSLNLGSGINTTALTGYIRPSG